LCVVYNELAARASSSEVCTNATGVPRIRVFHEYFAVMNLLTHP